jgi:hypothetical protein
MKDTPMAQILSGHVEIVLDGEKVTLAPTLFAATTICKHFGGFQAAIGKISAFDLESYAAVVRAGLGYKTEKDAAGLLDQVFASGVLNLFSPLSEYLMILANGGKPLAPAGAETDAPGKGES